MLINKWLYSDDRPGLKEWSEENPDEAKMLMIDVENYLEAFSEIASRIEKVDGWYNRLMKEYSGSIRLTAIKYFGRLDPSTDDMSQKHRELFVYMSSSMSEIIDKVR